MAGPDGRPLTMQDNYYDELDREDAAREEQEQAAKARQ